MAVIYTPIRFIVTVGVGVSSGTMDITIPGTYGGLTPTDPTAGRYFQSATIIADTPADQDYISNIKLVDSDSVVFTPERAFLPNYPDVVHFYDSADTNNANGLWLTDAGVTVLSPFDQAGGSQVRFLPAGLHLIATLTTATLLGKTWRGTILWGRWVNGP